MRSEVIKADGIDAAAERILDEFRGDNGSSRSVIYFDGWDGLGASAVLEAVARRLAATAAPPAGLQFDQIIQIDCSKWESRRAVQRSIVEQLKLPAWAMKMLDRQDEEDDFHGLAKGLRTEMQQVVTETFRAIQNHRFVVFFQNGSSEEIDLTKFGLPLYGYTRNKMVWTFRGRFRLNLRMEVDKAIQSAGVTDVFLTASQHEQDPHKLWSLLVHEEATQVSRSKVIHTTTGGGGGGGILYGPAHVEDYLLYMLKICGVTGGHNFIDYDLATHSSNYWICDAIVHQQQQGVDDGAWRAADALQEEMRLDVGCYHPHLSAHMSRRTETMPYCTSPDFGFLLTPAPNEDIFQQFEKLGTLKLSYCSFSFSSPPFLCCRSLRFLWLDHCEDQAKEINSSNTDEATENEQDIQRCFQRLWVLDMRYTHCDSILSTRMLGFMTQLRELNVMGVQQDWDMGQLHGRLPNIRKLRVTKSTVHCTSCSEEDLFSGMDKMELLDLSGNHTKKDGVTEISTSSNQQLQSVAVAEGCVGIQRFSFRGCAILKNLLLSGLFADLMVLDLSGTAIKTLDLSAMTARKLDELYLDDCEELCAILWPPKDRRKSYLQKLHINTTRSAAPASVHSSSSSKEENKSTDGSTSTVGVTKTSTTASLTVAHGARPPSELDWCITVKDSRLLRSLVTSFIDYFESHRVHVEISTPSHHRAIDIGGRKNGEKQVMSNNQQEQLKGNELVYGDVAVSISEEHLIQVEAGEGDAPTITRTWPCPPADRLDSNSCYLYTQDEKMKGMDGGTITIPSVICDHARILHVHDALSISSIPGHARWTYLGWCRVERCPRLNFIFTTPRLAAGSNVRIFYYLRTFWASQLPMARFLWDMNNLPASKIVGSSFEDLTLLHLEFCPRLIHVLPCSPLLYCARALKILEIVWCGDLRTVFPLLGSDDSESHKEQQHKATKGEIITVKFPNLKHMHLHELPKVQSICGRGRMFAPNLETIKIRGCWSLRHLPSINRDRSDKVECNCEKEWWDRLEWDGLDANHHHSLYKLKYSKYYKKTLLRGRVLI